MFGPRQGLHGKKSIEGVFYGCQSKVNHIGNKLLDMSGLPQQEVPNWQKAWEKAQALPEDLNERDKRYGRVFKVFDEDDQFVVRITLPQKTPQHPWLYRYNLPQTLSPYQMHVNITEEYLRIRGVMADEALKPLCGLINSFPDRFELALPIDFAILDFEVRFQEEYVVDIRCKKGKVHA